MTERIGYLEGLRGLAAFTVFLGHFIPFFIIVSPLMDFAFTGREFSVCIFFVLSGYVLTLPFFNNKKHETLVSSAVRRYIRLLIPILFFLFIIYFYVYPGTRDILDLKGFGDMISLAFWGVFVQGQITYFPAASQYTSVLWTITIEFIGSFIVFSFASLFGKLRNRWVFYIVALILFLNTYYLAFILGMILADGYNTELSRVLKIENPYILALIFLIALILGAFPESFETIGMYSAMVVLTTVITTTGPFAGTILFQPGSGISLSYFIHILGAFFLLFALINMEWLKKALSSSVPVFFGKISFSLYLIHILVIFAFSALVRYILFNNEVNFVSGIGTLTITLPVLFGASLLMYKYVDIPGIAFSKW